MAKSCFKITLKVKGNKTASGKIIKDLKTQITHINTFGVTFPYYHYDQNESKNGYSAYTIQTDEIKAYYLACRSIEKMVTWSRRQTAEYTILDETKNFHFLAMILISVACQPKKKWRF